MRHPKFIVREYVREDGSQPFRTWSESLPISSQARIQARIARFTQGNLGDAKPVGEGVHEARMTMGPGYRLYFGKDGKSIVLLLCGGDKGSQKKDIKRAKALWSEWKERGKE